ncbi:MAG: TetR/AcrR family transcriptional regulator [Nitrospirae bacterium]|nr:TetR/AcrR family transcriptional regulator [Nitrospirota bacterium]
MGYAERLSKPERRAHILQKAASAFGRSNYRRATTKAIAEESGVSEALLFQHFASKEEIFVESLREAGRELTGALERIIEEHLSDPLRAFAVAYTYFTEYLRDCPEYGRLVLSALSESQEPKVKEILNENIARAEMILEQGIRRGTEAGIFRSDVDIEVVKWIFVSGYHYMIISSQLGRLPAPDPRLMRSLLGPVLRGEEGTNGGIAPSQDPGRKQ